MINVANLRHKEELCYPDSSHRSWARVGLIAFGWFLYLLYIYVKALVILPGFYGFFRNEDMAFIDHHNASSNGRGIRE